MLNVYQNDLHPLPTITLRNTLSVIKQSLYLLYLWLPAKCCQEQGTTLQWQV